MSFSPKVIANKKDFGGKWPSNHIESILVGGFNPFENIGQIGSFPKVRVKIEKYLKPPPSYICIYIYIHTINANNKILKHSPCLVGGIHLNASETIHLDSNLKPFGRWAENPVINGVNNCKYGFFTPLTHVISAIYRGPLIPSPFTSGSTIPT